MKLTATTLAGLETVLAQELEALGAQNITVGKRAIEFEGDQKLLYRCNLELRTAIRVLVPIKEFKARNEEQLYRKIRKINWAEHLHVDGTLAVTAISNSTFFKHSKYVALKTKDAIVDRFRQDFRRRPNVDTKAPDLWINVRITQEDCVISLDSSLESLHKRGYRTESVAAPLNEVLSAGLILLSGWDKASPFIDPMCGSGTNLIEAALYAYNIPPQLQRREFGFMKWKNFDKALWRKVLEEAKARITTFDHEILGFDKDPRALRITNWNAIGAKVDDKIQVDRKLFEKLKAPKETGFLLMNPPYEQRLITGDINAFYKSIGDRLKQEFSGYEAWLISSNKEALKHIGLRPSKRMTLFNGPLECKFHKYELYQGSKKAKELVN